MHFRTFAVCGWALVLACGTLVAQSPVRPVGVASCQPGATTRLTLAGENFGSDLRAVASLPSAAVRVDGVEAGQAVVEVVLPADAPLGPFGLWLADASGPRAPIAVMVDDLPAVADNNRNHTVETAQPITVPCAVDGVGDGPQSDYYRLTVAAGQRIAFEIHTQAIRSTMDPVLRLQDAAGRTLHLADDAATGPECRFSYQFSTAGEYILEVSESRYASGGAYHLRIGDFPVIRHPFPLAVQRGQPARVVFAGEDEPLAVADDVTAPADEHSPSMTVSTRLPDGQSSASAQVLVSDIPQFVEPPAAATESPGAATPLMAPIGISGRFDRPKERDTYFLQGVKGQAVRVASRTRSLDCSTALHMELVDAAGTKVAATAVTDADEWSFDFTFPDDAVYRLEVRDLLHRGGPGFGYWIEVRPAGSIAVALKAAATTSERFAIEPAVGCAAVDLQISRFGFDGPLELTLDDAEAPLRILNPVIPAGAAEARVYIAADAEWSPASSAVVRLHAQAVGNPAIACSIDSVALHRLKTPQFPFPEDWSNGAVLLTAIPPGESFFTLEPSGPVDFARPVVSHVATLALKRLNPEFKGSVSILGSTLPAGWTVDVAVEQDVYRATFARNAEAATEPASLPLLAIAEHNGRSRIETISLPVNWIDPVQVTLQGPETLVPGQIARVKATVTRAGEPGPVKLAAANLPDGLTSVSDGVDVAADQSNVELEFQVAADFAATEAVLGIEATGTFGGQPFTVTARSAPIPVIPLPSRFEVYPPQIALDGASSRQQLVVTGFDASKTPRDWSREVTLSSGNAEVAEIRGNVVYPVAAGTTEIVIELGKIRTTIPVTVTLPETPRPIAFESEVLVALSKQGCNSGACHGSPSGKGGFRLSLRAFDKQLDELTLIREDYGRRINWLEPERSLLLAKPLMKVSHGGGIQLHEDDEAYSILRNWITEGARPDPPETPRCVRLEVYPSTKRIADLIAGGQQIAATAHFSDGTHRDVSHLVAYESSNTAVASVDEYGRVTPRERGETVILVRFLEHIESIPLMFVEEVEGFVWAAPPERNYIDTLVNEKLRQLRYLPSETCSDEVFLRRVYLDVIGALPSVEEAQAFLADRSEEKRAQLIDRLLEREEHARFWALKWGDLLRMTAKSVGDDGVYKYHRWVEEAIRTNMPYDEFAGALLTGSGSTLAEPPANFYRTATDTNDCVETVSQVFLGARLQCAKCHNHPFERWTQDNYYGLGAFFNRVQRRKTQRPGEMFIYSGGEGEVTQPRTGEVMRPWLPQVGSIDVAAGEDRREAFARWLAEPDNPYLARVEVNRIWSQLFARGIVDPIDDFRDSNPPTNERLLDALAQDFVDSGFDRKQLLRTILNSRTYQASHETNRLNETDQLYFSHQTPRLLTAEQLLDSLNHVTGLTQTFGTLPPGTKATHLPAPDVVKVAFLEVFGQPERSTVCACERADDSNLAMAIELLNGTLVHEKLRDANNRFRKAVAAGRPTDEIIRELYLASVCRPPTNDELQIARSHCERNPEDVAAALEDVCWALFNTDEFLFQH